MQKRRVAADEAAGDSEQLKLDKAKLTLLRQEYREFSKAAGLRSRATGYSLPRAVKMKLGPR